MAARESAEVKKAVAYVTDNGRSPAEAATLAGVNVTSVYRALERRGLHIRIPDPSKAPNKSREPSKRKQHGAAPASR